MTDLSSAALVVGTRSERLDQAIHGLLAQTPELEAAAVVSFDGLPMAAALPPSMDEDRVAAMSAALLSLGERAAQGLGRGELSQVYIEGDAGTVFLVSADDEAVLVAVASKGAKVGMMLYEVRRTAAVVADVLRAEDTPFESPVSAALREAVAHSAPVAADVPAQAVPEASLSTVPVWASTVGSAAVADETSYAEPAVPLSTYAEPVYAEPALPESTHAEAAESTYTEPALPEPTYSEPTYVSPLDSSWSSYAPTGSVMPGGGVPPSSWS